MPDIVLKDRAGNDLTYAGAPSVKVPDTSGELIEFFFGEKVEKTIDPDFSEGNIEVTAENGTFLEKVTVNKPEALLPENIREGETVAGITGTLPAYELTDKTVDLDFSGGDMSITPEEGKAFGNVNIPKPIMLIPDNIVKDIEIAGVTGTFEGGGGDNFEADIIAGTLSGHYFNPSVSKIRGSAFTSFANLTGVSFPLCESIGNSAFAYCYSLTSLSFPTCKFIAPGAFYWCSSITKICFPQCVSVMGSAFTKCIGLTEADFPLCELISSYTFGQCSTLKTINFPVCKNIGHSALGTCYSLTSVNFPKCEIINTNAFYYDRNLTTVSFPICSSIGQSAFVSCTALKSVFFPECTVVMGSAFWSCYNLSTVSLPKCTSIGGYAFYRCSALESLYILGTSYISLGNVSAFVSTPLSRSTFTGAFGSIFVRESMLASYITRTYWSAYSSRFVGLTDDEIAALEVTE